MGVKGYTRLASLTTTMIAGTDGSFSGWNWASKLSARASAFSESERASPSGVTRGGDGVGILITRLVIFHSDWSSGSRLSRVLLHRSFLHLLSWLVTDLCRRLIAAFKTGSLVICHCLLNRFFRRISSWMDCPFLAVRCSYIALIALLGPSALSQPVFEFSLSF